MLQGGEGGLVAQSCLTLCNSMDCSPQGSSVHGIFPGKNTEMNSCFLLQGEFPDPGIKPGSPVLQQSPALQADYVLTEPPGKPHSECITVL